MVTAYPSENLRRQLKIVSQHIMALSGFTTNDNNYKIANMNFYNNISYKDGGDMRYIILYRMSTDNTRNLKDFQK